MNFKLMSLIPLLITVSACNRVEPGHVGIKVNNWGSNAGVDPKPLGVGLYYAGPGVDIYEYPVYTSTYSWTRDSTEGSPTNEEFQFQDKNGLSLSADVSIAFRVDSSKSAILFQKYRLDMDKIVSGPIRTAVRNAIVENASNFGVEEIYGPKKAYLIAKSLSDVRKYFEPFGLEIEQLYWASNIRVPDSVMKQINLKIANEQAAMAAQASVATAEANARSRVADAEGKAQAMKVEATAIATNPEILQLRAVEKWDGHYPTYVGGGMPLPNLPLR